MIKHINDKWILFTKDGNKRLGIHKTYEEALAQERAVKANKPRAASTFRALLDGTVQAKTLKAEGSEHPFAYCMSNVVPAMEREGKAPEDPEAFCGWWKAERAAEVRHLHLRGALGAIHTAPFDGKEYLVVPVVALMEGVIHAVNAETPERVTFETLKKAASSWEGKPIVLGHPKGNDGKQCSADDPEIQASHAFGFIKNSHVVGKKLLMEAWVDPVRASELGGEDFAADLRNGSQIEVSVGAYVRTDNREGKENGKPYKGTWIDTFGDHLAFLPNGRGACSIEMGCGANRAAMHLVTAQGFEVAAEEITLRGGCTIFTALEDKSLDERMQAVNAAVQKAYGISEGLVSQGAYVYAQQVFDDRVIIRKGDDLWSVPYQMTASGEITFGNPTKVKQIYVAAGMRTAAGARHSSKDMETIQSMHDSAVTLGAMCDRRNYRPLSDKQCKCKEKVQ